MTRMIVVCAGDQDTKFDRRYYTENHLALTMECWRPYGLEAAESFFPAGNGDGWMAIGVYRFREAGDIARALAAPESARIMADVDCFTDAKTVLRSIFAPL